MAGAIAIVGLGPGDPNLLTRSAWECLAGASQVYLRTSFHPGLAGLPAGPTYHSLDDCYEAHDTAAEVYRDIAQRVVTLAAHGEDVVYAVPGDPSIGEATVPQILALADEAQIPVQVHAGISFVAPVCRALGIDPLDGLQIADGTLLAQRIHPPLDPDVAVLVAQVYNRNVAAEVKLTLLALYAEQQPVTIVRHAGLEDQSLREIALFELDRQDDLDHLTSLYLPPLARPGSLSSYQELVGRLRAPDGCPWDRAQTHESLRSSLLEETYEVLGALDSGDPEELCEELGDLLLQVLFHASLATEHGDFRLIDSVSHAIDKLVRRHPHVFSDAVAEDAETVLLNWEQIKRQERGDKESEFRSMLASINNALPALAQALDVQQRVARVGFDWPSREDVLAKVQEELHELSMAEGSAQQEAELGDVLFSLVNLARWYHVDPESALRQANSRFRARFGWMEAEAHRAGTPLEQLSLQEMDDLWERAKDEFEASSAEGE